MNRLQRCLILCFLLVQIAVPAFGAADRATHLDTGANHAPPEAVREQDGAVGFTRDYFSGYVTDFTDMLTAPGSWDGSDWIIAALVSGIAVGLYEHDAKIQRWVLRNRTTTTDSIGDNGTDLGHGKYTAALLGGMYVYGRLADDGKMRSTVLLSAESFILTGVFVQVLKNSTHRHRPFTNDGPRAWGGPGVGSRTAVLSFPSGHASSAFAVASVIAGEYDNVIVPALAYGVASITALNRVSHNAHWSSDVFVGSAIGYFTGKAVISSHRGKEKTRLGLVPFMTGNETGISAAYSF